MFCAAIDMPKVQSLLAALHQAILASDPNVSVQTVVYACACIQANALIARREMSVPFRGKILAGLGDMAGSMMRAGLAQGLGDEAERAIPPSRAEIPDSTKRELRESAREEEQAGGTDLYNRLVDDDADVYSLEEFRQMVEDGALTDEDGQGHFAIKDEPDCYYEDGSYTVAPSEFNIKEARGASHVVWYNK